MAEAKIMQFTGRRVRQPSSNVCAVAKVPPASAALKQIEPSDRAAMQSYARESLRNGILQFRQEFGSTKLAAFLLKLAENELHLAEFGS